MIRKLSNRFKVNNDTGFANLATSQGNRLLNTDGTYNVVRKGMPFFDGINVFHELISMKWIPFLFIVLLFYICINLIFGAFYYFIGIEHLDGTDATSEMGKFLEAFFFSTQTFATVGYGKISPIGLVTNIIAAFEALLGVLSLALVTSLLYSRFAKPRPKLTFSKNIIISPFKENTALMFRFANKGEELLIECEAQILMSYMEKDGDKNARKFMNLVLEREKVAALALNWTVVHPINEDSPLFGLSAQDLADSEMEFLFLLKAFDDTYSQIVHLRYSYTFEDLIWGAKFRPMFFRAPKGSATVLELDKIDDHDLIPLGKQYFEYDINGILQSQEKT